MHGEIAEASGRRVVSQKIDDHVLQAYRKSPLAVNDIYKKLMRGKKTLEEVLEVHLTITSPLIRNGIKVFYGISQLTTRGNKEYLNYRARNDEINFNGALLGYDYLKRVNPSLQVFICSAGIIFGKMEPGHTEWDVVMEFERKGTTKGQVQEEFRSYNRRLLVGTPISGVLPISKVWKSEGGTDEMDTAKEHGIPILWGFYEHPPALKVIGKIIERHRGMAWSALERATSPAVA